MSDNFDLILNDKLGIIFAEGAKFGKGVTVFIKVGKGGTIYGNNDKYLRLAHSMSKIFGTNVVVSANSEGSKCVLAEEFQTVRNAFIPMDEVAFVGYSDGALIGAQQATYLPEVSYMLLINGPLNINWIKTKKGIESFRGKKVHMIYGTLDPSYKYIELLKLINSDFFSFDVIDGADHYFTNMEDEFSERVHAFVSQSILEFILNVFD